MQFHCCRGLSIHKICWVFDNLILKTTSEISVTSQANYPKKESYQHPELVVCQRQELPEVMMAAIPEDRTRKSSSSTGTGSRSSSRARQKSRSRSRSKSSERMLQKLDPIEYDIDQGKIFKLTRIVFFAFSFWLQEKLLILITWINEHTDIYDTLFPRVCILQN